MKRKIKELKVLKDGGIILKEFKLIRRFDFFFSNFKVKRLWSRKTAIPNTTGLILH